MWATTGAGTPGIARSLLVSSLDLAFASAVSAWILVVICSGVRP
jgi:hypothetical protein